MTPLFKTASPQEALIIDTSNLAYRCAYAGQDLITSEGRPSGHILLSVKSLSTLRKRYPYAELVFALDVPHETTFRAEIYPEYKANREEKNRLEYDPVREVCALVSAMKCKVAYADGYEADDVIASLVAQQDKQRYVVVSSDKDLWSLLKFSNVTILNPNAEVERRHFIKAFGDIDPTKVPMHKAILGDKSDNIPKVPRIRTKKVVELIQGATTLDDVFAKAPEILSVKELSNLQTNAEMVRTNLKLTTLRESISAEVMDCPGDKALLMKMFELYEATSLERLVQYLIP